MDSEASVEQKEKRQKVNENFVTLNVGGKLYTTTITTLQMYPDSMLAKMFSEHWAETADKNGHYVIDRNGKLFSIVLEYLRTGCLFVPQKMRNSLDYNAILNEATYFNLDGLISLVSEKIQTKENETTFAFDPAFFPLEIDLIAENWISG